MYTGVSNLSRHYITYLSINFVHFICDSHCIFILVKKNIIFAQCLTYIPTYIYLPLPRYIAKTAWKNDTYTVFVFSKNLKKRTKKKIIKIYVQVPNELYRKKSLNYAYCFFGVCGLITRALPPGSFTKKYRVHHNVCLPNPSFNKIRRKNSFTVTSLIKPKHMATLIKNLSNFPNETSKLKLTKSNKIHCF